ncbi:uncharacterized protein CANTADRAFT_6492 [Suhomyces tanzawaensis NRRL Y-17324]|uniref:SPX domain-containing protein n=1 Tax=Suhomyces tanzawaensis NRRL Y-17324 TaxID=984487 RepID=A0A1E4SIU2_9ASCO|nr:uncharacterized protein CANTADRAFT_6492 [Suhomyces tanzawaensis NRRL Y-17324]ODV79357.1 hypothetical protein CANTADRAFT_6492 [Suhomyces tanzawaensis NRRL Y-17324]
MKFGNNLHHLSIPEWRSYNIDYNDLKAQIRAITQGKPDGLVPLRQSFLDNFDYINLFVQTKHGELVRKVQYFQVLFRQVASVASSYDASDAASGSPSTRQELRMVLYDMDEIFYGAIDISVVLKNLSKFILIQKIAVKKIMKKFLKYYTADPDLAASFVFGLKESLFQNPASFINFDLSGLTKQLTDFMKEIKQEQKLITAKLNGTSVHDDVLVPKSQPPASHQHQKPVSSESKFDMTIFLKKNFNLHFLLPSDTNNLIELVLNLNITLNFKGNNEESSDLSFLFLTNDNDLHAEPSYIISQKNLSYSTIIAHTGGLRKHAYCVLPNNVVQLLLDHLLNKDDPVSLKKLASYFDLSTSPLTKITLDAILSKDLKPSMKLVCKRLRYILKKNHEEEEHQEIEQQENIRKDSIDNAVTYDDEPPRVDQISLAPSSDTKQYQDDYYITLDHDIYTTDDPQLTSNIQFHEPSSSAFTKFDRFPHNHLSFYSNDSNLSNFEHSMETSVDSKNGIVSTTYPATKFRKLPTKIQNIISTNNSLNMFKSLSFYQYMISCYYNAFPRGDFGNNHYSKLLNLNLLKSFENVQKFNNQLNVDSKLKRNLSMKSLASAGAMAGATGNELKRPPPLVNRNSTISVVSNYSIPSIFTDREEEDDDDTKMLQFYDQSPLKLDKDVDEDYYSLYVKLNEEYDHESSLFNTFMLKSHKLKRKLVTNIGKIFDGREKEPILPQYYSSSHDGKTKYGYGNTEGEYLINENPYSNYDSINEEPPSFLDRNRFINIHKEYEFEYDQTLAYIYFCLNLICIFLSGIELGIVYSIFMDMDIPSNESQFTIANNLWLILVLPKTQPAAAMSQFNPEDFKKYANYLVTEVEEGVVHLQLNNTKRLNAFSEQFWRDYHEIFVKLDQLESTKVILVSSSVPRAFTTGLDLKSAMAEMALYSGLSPLERQAALKKHIEDFQYCVGIPARISTPTIGLLNGLNLGLALDLAACYSIRVATEDAKFCIAEIKIGIAADIGSLQRLPALFNNKGQLFQYCLTGETFGSQDGLRLGYVTKVVPDLKSGVEYIKELASNISPYQGWAIRGTKKCIQDILDGQSVEEGLKFVADYNSKNIPDTFAKKPAKL